MYPSKTGVVIDISWKRERLFGTMIRQSLRRDWDVSTPPISRVPFPTDPWKDRSRNRCRLTYLRDDLLLSRRGRVPGETEGFSTDSPLLTQPNTRPLRVLVVRVDGSFDFGGPGGFLRNFYNKPSFRHLVPFIVPSLLFHFLIFTSFS